MNASAVFGLVVMVLSEALTLAKVEPAYSWNTPICWTGFILFADGVAFRARGASLLRSTPGEFARLALLSIPLWLAFEFFNLYIDNWYYVGLPENRALRLFGYAWSFATIWPAIFEAADLIAVWRRGPAPLEPLAPFEPLPRLEPPGPAERRRHVISIAAGALMLAWPLVWPSRYLAAPVWLGFIFLLDPINAQMGAASLETDLRRGRYDRPVDLALSGVLCGFLWEFWNYWAGAKWHYTVPILERFKLFEMPLPGFLGFPAFALECFTMYVFARKLVIK